MKRTIQFLMALLFLAGFNQFAMAQTEENPLAVTIRQLNDYSNVTLDGTEDLGEQLYNDDSYVTFVAVISNEPLNSGIRSFNSDAGTIGSFQFFATDTSAYSSGRMGMSLRVNEEDLTLEDDFFRGDIVEIVGQMGFFGEEVQFNISSINYIASVFDTGTTFEKYASLLEPVSINISDVVQVGEDGSMGVKWDAYSDYNNMYVKFEGATIDFVNIRAEGFGSSNNNRPNWAVRQGDAVAIIYDLSLRMRNDRTPYRNGYNWRRPVDSTDVDGETGAGPFVPPAIGSLVNLTGFLTLDTFDPGGYGGDSDGDGSEDDEAFFKINPMSDGVFWEYAGPGDDGVQGTGDDLYDKITQGVVNDIEVVGQPPVLENFTVSNRFPAPDEQVVVGVDAFDQSTDGNAGIDSVYVSYTANSVEGTFNLVNSEGNTFEGQFPTFASGTIVTYSITAVTNAGLMGVYPPSGTENLVVSSGFDSISLLQSTSDGGVGASAFDGEGMLDVNITATVTADSADGFIVVHDGSDAFSGIFLDWESDVRGENRVNGLMRGDEILIDSLEIDESRGDVTFATNVVFTVTSSGNDISGLIPSLTSDQVSSMSEAYEGMVITITDAMVDTTQADGDSDFGEFSVRSEGAKEAVRVDDNGPGPGSFDNISSGLNENMKTTTVFDITGVLNFSFGNFKMVMRNYDDVSIDNYTWPERTLTLQSPADEADVTIDTDVVVEWEASEDFDGGEVTYKWFLAAEADSAFESPVAVLVSDNNGEDPMLTLPFATVDGLLDGLGVNVGGTINTVWTVFVYSQGDSVQVSNYVDNEFVATFNKLTVTRAAENSLENEVVPDKFGLEQNYPNPFNPSTNINYSIPVNSQVTLEVYNMLGRRVASLVSNEVQTAGTYTVTFDASQLASGIYFYRIQAGGFVKTQKMTLIK